VICADVRRNRAFPPKRPTPSIRRPFSILSARPGPRKFPRVFLFFELGSKIGQPSAAEGGHNVFAQEASIPKRPRSSSQNAG
jgi:hypothetical protein